MALRLELPVRWTEEIFDEEGGVEVKYTTGRLCIPSEEITAYYDIDEKHTMIRDINGKGYCLCVPFDDFKKIHTECTGIAIMAIKEIIAPSNGESPKPGRRKRRGDDNDTKKDDDDILM